MNNNISANPSGTLIHLWFPISKPHSGLISDCKAVSGLLTGYVSLFQDKIDHRRQTTDDGIMHLVGFGAFSVLVAIQKVNFAKMREHVNIVNA